MPNTRERKPPPIEAAPVVEASPAEPPELASRLTDRLFATPSSGGTTSPAVSNLYTLLQNRDNLAVAVMLMEVFNKPLSKRRRPIF